MKRITNLLGLFTRPKPQVGMTPSDVVFAENKWKLLRYRPRPEGVAFKTPVLLVPSLINRHYVLDLMPGKSFAEYLVAQGFDVFCVDWGTPSDEDRFVTFDDVVDGYLGRAIRQAAKDAPEEKVHVLGYCMGGSLAAIHLAAHPEHVASFVALAAPIRFKDDGILSRWTNARGFDVDAIVNGSGNVPWQLMQAAFHLIRPTLGLSKAVMVLDRAWNDEFLDGFLALETWGNDNVSMPGEFYKTYIHDLYQSDLLVAGRFVLKGKRVDLKQLTCPTLAVTFEHDSIVPAASASVLMETIGAKDKQHVHLPGGHVGAVVSKHAAKTLWPQLSGFFAEREVRAAVKAPPVVEKPVSVEKKPAKKVKRPAVRESRAR